MHGTNVKIFIPEFSTARLLARRSGVRFPESAEDFLFYAMSILSLGPSVHWVPEPYSSGVSQPEREVNHILTSAPPQKLHGLPTQGQMCLVLVRNYTLFISFLIRN